jgi:NADH-quinone oxidoreductase subunit M
MLWMIQRIFYGGIGYRPNEVPGWDLTPREHLELWPFAALFLLLGVASPLFMRAIDTFGAPIAGVTHDAPVTLVDLDNAGRDGRITNITITKEAR